MKLKTLLLVTLMLSSCAAQDIELTYSKKLGEDDVPQYALGKNPKERFTNYFENGVSFVYDRSVSKILHDSLNASIVCKCNGRKVDKRYLKLFSFGKWGLYDFKLREILPIQYDEIDALNEIYLGGNTLNYTIVKDSELIGVMNESFEYIIQPRYQFLSNPECHFSSEPSVALFIGNKNGKFGIIDQVENIHTPFKYDTIHKTKSAMIYSVEIASKKGLITTENEIICPIEWTHLNLITFFDYTELNRKKFIACYGKGGKYGLVSNDGLITDLISEIPITYTGCCTNDGDYPEHFYIIQDNGKQGLINDKGKYILNAEFDKIEEINFDKLVERYNKRFIYKENHSLGNHSRICPSSDAPLYDIRNPIYSRKDDNIVRKLKLGIYDLFLKKGTSVDTLNVYIANDQEVKFVPISLVNLREN